MSSALLNTAKNKGGCKNIKRYYDEHSELFKVKNNGWRNELMDVSLTKKVAKYACELKYEDIPTEVVDEVKISLRDYLAVAIAGSKEPVNERIRAFVNTISGSGKLNASVFGQSEKCSVERAALVNGTIAHALDFDDCQAELHGHPSVVLWSTIIPLGEVYDISGESAIAAYVASSEVMCKLCGAIEKTHYGKGWHATGSGGIIGAAVAAAYIMRFDVNQIINTLGLASSFASGVRGNFGSMAKPLHAGWAAQNGIIAALMTKEGITAMPEILEKSCGYIQCFSSENIEDVIDYVSNIGKVYSIMKPGLKYKAFPCCNGAHPPICAALLLREKVPMIQRVENIERVIAYVQPWQNTTLVYPRPKTGLQAKFSLQYCLARAIIYGKVTIDDFDDEAIWDEEVQKLIPKIEMIATVDMDEYNRLPTIEMYTIDGQKYTEKSIESLGHILNPMSEEQHINKFLSCTASVIGQERAEKVLKLLNKFEKIHSIKELLDLLYQRL